MIRAALTAAIGSAMALAAPSPALAQAYQCTLPTGPVSVPVVRQGEVRRMPATRYSLSLSWSPEYCKGRERSAADATQCSGRSGRFGLILHGLWPEGAGGGWPQYCPATARLSGAEARRNLCMTPSARLQAHQWQKHGSCMAKTPEAYFATARRLWAGLQIPDLDRLSRRQGLTAGDIRTAIATANPTLRRNGIAVVLNQRGWLQELRLCYDRQLRPAACDARRSGAPDSATAKIWRGL